VNVLPSKVKCLLVDDVEENLLVLSALLRRNDVELLLARSGAEALDLLLAHDVALALIDVQMPEMDGFELAELMRGSERTRHVPIIFVTAGGRDYQRLFRGYDSGAVDFLYKPIEPWVLQSKADVFFQLYRQREQLIEELRERTETLRLHEMFAAVLSHDLRNPLNAIATGAQLIQENPGEAFAKQASARILSSSQRMARMIEDLLDLTRARLAEGIPIARSAVDLGTVIARVAQEHQVSHPTRRITVTSEGSLTGYWDGDRLGQVTSNLIGNALQYGAEEQPIVISVNGTQPDALLFSVTNSGTIPTDLLPRIFEPFSGGGDQARPRSGLGLGLYIAQQIVLSHQGRIHVESSGGHTTFVVTVPRSLPQDTAVDAEADMMRS
jgi:two-component system sensor histidine kinase/response regulator